MLQRRCVERSFSASDTVTSDISRVERNFNDFQLKNFCAGIIIAQLSMEIKVKRF